METHPQPLKMFDGFTPFDIQTQSTPPVTIHGITNLTSTGPPLVLIHGFPQTHHIWHLVTPLLQSKYKLILLDIRGYGASSKPDGVSQYVKSIMARDVAVVMETLGFSQYFVCAHDRGARVAHKLLVDYPDRVQRAILLDICPTLAMFEYTNQEFATAYWHWFFLIQKAPLPEKMVTDDARGFAELFMGGRLTDGYRAFHENVFEEYVKSLGDVETVHGMCEDYRAAATLDLDEARKDLEVGRKIKTPLKILWGKKGVIEKCFDGVGEWQKVSDAEVVGESLDCGHYVPEEQPEALVKHILDFLVQV